MKVEAVRDFYDFSQNKVLEWKKQAKRFPHVSFFYDKVQKAYCRKVSKVPGIIKDGHFYPHKNKIVNYKQVIRN